MAGTWHHVMNRGIARRTVFENAVDVRYFLSRLARVVRSGVLEVHAYCVLTTHFHLLVRSPTGKLSEAMRVVLNDYVRWFNRGRHRDGALFRGRFRSKPVESVRYRELLVRYIDFNPVGAGLVVTPGLYPHGSARWYLVARRPPWLERTWIESAVCEFTRSERYDPRQYPEYFGEALSPALHRVVMRRLEGRGQGVDPLDDLLDATPEAVLEWMRRKAQLADGTSIGLPMCDTEHASEMLQSQRERQGAWSIAVSRKSTDAWRLVKVALLRDLCAARWSEVAARVAMTPEGARECYRRHRIVMLHSQEYARAVAGLAQLAVRSQTPIATIQRLSSPAPLAPGSSVAE
jgi:REP element-mobilizing transposase RayT